MASILGTVRSSAPATLVQRTTTPARGSESNITMAKKRSKRKWAKDRAKKLANMEWPTTRAGWIARWKRHLTVIRDKVRDLWADRWRYNEYRKIVLSNAALDKRAGFFHLVDDMYVSHVLVAIRTFDDPDRRAYSLFNLIEEIRDHVSQLDKAWFVNRYRKDHRWIGERDFAKNWDGRNAISKRRVAADLRSLVALCRRARVAVDKHLAHNDKRKPKMAIAYKDVDAALDGIFELVSRYHALLFGSSWATPSLLSSAYVFKLPWLPQERRA